MTTALRAWDGLPAEMKLSIVDLLDFDSIQSLAMVNRESYTLCVPSIFRVSALLARKSLTA